MDQHPIHYTESGNGPPLLLIHGLFDSSETWDSCTPYLLDRFKVFLIDLPAFGKSPLPERWEESLSETIQTVIAFLDKKGIRKIALVGSSMGGSMALGVAARYPERIERLILINPYGLPSVPTAVAMARNPIFKGILPYLLIKPVLKTCARVLYTRSIHNRVLLSDAMIEQVIKPFCSLRRRKALFRFLDGISAEGIKEIDAGISEMRHPVLILWGKEDRWLKKGHWMRLHDRLSNSQVIFIPQCGHLPQIEKPKEVSTYILSFLERPLY